MTSRIQRIRELADREPKNQEPKPRIKKVAKEVGVLEYPIIQTTEEPETKTWAFPPLYKGNTEKNTEQLWMIGFDGRELVTRWGFTHTETDFQTTTVEVEPKGKRSLQEQALQEARNKYLLKCRAGYRRKGQKTPTLVKLMKGQKYDPEKTKLSPEFGMELKIDGIRGSMHWSGDRVMYISYGNKPMRAFPHLDEHFKELLIWLPTNSIVDFEFYNHDLDFNEIQSIVTTHKTDHPDLEKIEGWVFDYYCASQAQPYEIRRQTLEVAFEQLGPDTRLRLIEQRVGRSKKDIEKFMAYALENKYEGIMLKRMSCGAEPDTQAYKRSLYCTTGSHSTHIYKYKKMLDEEGIICGYESAKGREKGLVMFHIIDMRGNEIPVRMKGTFEQRAKWFKEGHKYISQILNYEYQELSKDGVARFPIGCYFRKRSDMDPKIVAHLERLLEKYQREQRKKQINSDSEASEDEQPKKTIRKSSTSRRRRIVEDDGES
jgi:predicted DNA-binding WGR domain protein